MEKAVAVLTAQVHALSNLRARAFLTRDAMHRATSHGPVSVRQSARAFNGPLSGTTRVSWYQKGKTNMDFTEARDSEWQYRRHNDQDYLISPEGCESRGL